jgi:hypothetical protein
MRHPRERIDEPQTKAKCAYVYAADFFHPTEVVIYGDRLRLRTGRIKTSAGIFSV